MWAVLALINPYLYTERNFHLRNNLKSKKKKKN